MNDAESSEIAKLRKRNKKKTTYKNNIIHHLTEYEEQRQNGTTLKEYIKRL